MTSRRAFLKLGGVAVLGTLASACNSSKFGAIFGRPEISALQPTGWRNSAEERAAAHLLKRLSYGPRPGQIDQVAEQIASGGARVFIEQQLQPESINDDQAYWLTRRIETLNLNAPDIFDLNATEAIDDLRRATILRACYSERQLQEIMVEFWNDHFNIYAAKTDCGWLKVIDDREVARKHALGKFRDLLRASATSAAMLCYLDGRRNEKASPNENYARELLELHTLGVDGGYSQKDVMETARALTGWQVKDHLWRGRVRFDGKDHDSSTKRVLNHQLNSGNEQDLAEVIEIVSKHPATAHFISMKLARRFVGDHPSEKLINKVARRFQESDGDIRETLRTLLLDDQFLKAPPKLKRPYTFAISTLRALGARCDGGSALQQHLRDMGQLPFNWPTPNGYPDGEEHWRAQLLPRWNFALDLLNGEIKGSQVTVAGRVEPRSIAPALLQRDLTKPEHQAIAEVKDLPSQLALICCMPDFQYQ